MSNNNVCESCGKKGNKFTYPRRREMSFFKSWFKSPDEWVCESCWLKDLGVDE